jgi:squalene-hopene/tetraprenyl-beta-curcumene cyclase
MRTRSLLTLGAALATTMTAANTVSATPDDAHRAKAEQMIDKAIAYLRTQQDEATGGWSVPENGPNIPAITSLVLNGMLMSEDIDGNDPDVAQGLNYVYSFQQDNGGIYDLILANYNTAITISALTKLENDPKARLIIDRALPFLKRLQWSEDAIPGRDDTAVVDRSHPYYGGVGYGGSGRPDNSNLNLMLQALHDAGVAHEDQAFQRALVFLQRTQMLHKDENGNLVNDMPYAEGSQQGGFIYATSPNEDNQGVGESKAGMIEETLSDGTIASRFRSYGSMTYAGFKSYLYANLQRDDPRVQAAYNWLRENYTLEENPGIGTDGYYYFLITMSRAMDAWGEPEIKKSGEPVELTGRISPADLPRSVGESAEITKLTDKTGRVFELAQPLWVYSIHQNPESEDPSESDTIHSRSWKGLRFADSREFEILSQRVNGPSRDETGIVATIEIRFIEPRNWSNDLIAKLAEMQNEDGSFRSVDDRWMENNPVLITAYSLIALQHAID